MAMRSAMRARMLFLRSDGRAVDLDRDTAAQKLDVQHESAFRCLVLHEDPFEAAQRSFGDLHTIALQQTLVRDDRHFGFDYLLNRIDFGVGHWCEARPTVFEHSDNAARLENFDVAPL